MGLFRLLFYIIAGYLAYLLIRSLFKKTGVGRDDGRPRPGHTDNARLEADPVCGVYISRETAVRRNIGGREIFFCGEQCANKYLAEQAGKS